MNLIDLSAEMEADFKWRQDEIRFFQNQINSLRPKGREDQYRRALIVLLYAHFEGYCKFALTAYINSINGIGLLCRDANSALAASTLSDLLAALRQPTSKCAEFKHSAPDDSSLHLFAREREFVEKTYSFLDRAVNIPDGVIDTESNLSPTVLRKNLFRLGLPLDVLTNQDGKIHQLLKSRNKISHGESKEGVTLTEYERISLAAFEIMEALSSAIREAIRQRNYLRDELRAPSAAAADLVGGSEKPLLY